MQLHEVTTEEIHAELHRRKSADTAEIRKQIDEHKKAIRDLEAKIHGGKNLNEARNRSKCDIPTSDRFDRIVAALTGVEGANVAQIAEKAGFGGAALSVALKRAVNEGKILKSGKARGTTYSL